MAQVRIDAASAAISRAVSATTDRFQRTHLLPAYVEVMVSAGKVKNARNACRELAEVAETFDAGVLGAMAVPPIPSLTPKGPRYGANATPGRIQVNLKLFLTNS